MASELSKPAGLAPKYGEQFKDRAIVRAYRHRAPYPDETFALLAKLAGEGPSVLDLGCGTGDLTAGISAFATTVDAIDVSHEMIAEAENRSLPNVRWIIGAAESAPLAGPYDLIAAGESLHWMEWPRLFPRLASVLKPHAVLAIVEREYVRTTWWTDDFQKIIDRFSTNTDYRKYDLIAELQERRLFAVEGSHQTEPVPFAQPVEDLVEAFHSRNGFSRDRMTSEAAHGFDLEASTHLSRFADAGVMSLGVQATVTWGRVIGAGA